jgi:hypothetical protein
VGRPWTLGYAAWFTNRSAEQYRGLPRLANARHGFQR